MICTKSRPDRSRRLNANSHRSVPNDVRLSGYKTHRAVVPRTDGHRGIGDGNVFAAAYSESRQLFSCRPMSCHNGYEERGWVGAGLEVIIECVDVLIGEYFTETKEVRHRAAQILALFRSAPPMPQFHLQIRRRHNRIHVVWHGKMGTVH